MDICNKFRNKPHICKPEHVYLYYLITLYPNYVHEFNYVKPYIRIYALRVKIIYNHLRSLIEYKENIVS